MGELVAQWRLRDGAASKIPSPADCAYAAGFFDGEGSIQLMAPNKKFGTHIRLKVEISQVDPRPLLWLSERFGGPVRQSDKRSVGTRRRIVYRWYLCGRNALGFLALVRPHLIVKADQADLAHSFYKTVQRKGGIRVPLSPEALAERLRIKAEIKRLQLTEWPLDLVTRAL